MEGNKQVYKMFSMRNQETYTGLTVVSSCPQGANMPTHSFPLLILLAAVLKFALLQFSVFITNLKLFPLFAD